MIIFDSSYLVVFLNPNPPAAMDRNGKPVEKFKERVQYLAAKFDASNEPIGIPAPAMAEASQGWQRETEDGFHFERPMEISDSAIRFTCRDSGE